jgi:hypothetical protein
MLSKSSQVILHVRWSQQGVKISTDLMFAADVPRALACPIGESDSVRGGHSRTADDGD